MSFPELGIAGSCKEVPDVSGRMEEVHHLEVDEGRLGLVHGKQDVVDPEQGAPLDTRQVALKFLHSLLDKPQVSIQIHNTLKYTNSWQ